jgi:hypothetical protein
MRQGLSGVRSPDRHPLCSLRAAVQMPLCLPTSKIENENDDEHEHDWCPAERQTLNAKRPP